MGPPRSWPSTELALHEAEKLQYKRAKVAAEPAPAKVAAEPASGDFFYALSDLQACTLAALGLPNAASSDTISASNESELFASDLVGLDTALVESVENMTAEESIEMMLTGDSCSANPSQPPLGLDHQQHGGPQAEGAQSTFGEIAESSGPPLTEYLPWYPPTGHERKPARGNASLQELFVTHVMCDYTPRHPESLPLSAWISLERLSSQLAQHASAEVALLGQNGVKQIIAESQMNHPAFAGLRFSAWCKKLKDERPLARYRAQIIKFPFVYTRRNCT